MAANGNCNPSVAISIGEASSGFNASTAEATEFRNNIHKSTPKPFSDLVAHAVTRLIHAYPALRDESQVFNCDTVDCATRSSMSGETAPHGSADRADVCSCPLIL